MHTLIHSSFQMSTLLTLPNELIIQILQKLVFSELAAVRKTCRLLRELTLDDVVMRDVAKATQQQWNITMKSNQQPATSRIRTRCRLRTGQVVVKCAVWQN